MNSVKNVSGICKCDKSERELNWWKQYYHMNKERFYDIRNKDWEDRSYYLQEIKGETGIGLDYGCGLLSMLEFSDLKFDAIDPLMNEYRELMDLPSNYHVDTNKKYDWVWCINVLDHTPYPDVLIKDAIKRLKKGGRLYLEVNLDDVLGTECHYERFTKEKIDELVTIHKDYEKIIRNENDKQYYYFAKYTR